MNKVNRRKLQRINSISNIIINNIKKPNLINNYRIIKKTNMYRPILNNKKFLTIIATHVNSDIKYSTLLNNIKLLSFDSNEIVVINSSNLNYNIKDFCNSKNITYFEIDNDSTYDYGKWVYALETINYTNYDYIVLTNDSYIIHSPIHHFYNLTAKNNVELYGYNDSTQNGYHYQSYLFSLRSDVIQKFIDIFKSKKNIINSQQDVINEFELKITSFFNSYNCFLKIGNLFENKTRNIFFNNDKLYYKLFINNLLPFTKIKRIT
jgi:hypothetical protein